MIKFLYVQLNVHKSNEIRKEDLFEEEKILFRSEEIKLDDELNKEYNLNLFLTNFRFVLLNHNSIFDIPLIYVETYRLKKPIFKGSKFIQLNLNFTGQKPNYILDKISQNEFNSFTLPKTCKLKFRNKNSDIESCSRILEESLKNEDYKKIIKRKNQNIFQFSGEKTKNKNHKLISPKWNCHIENSPFISSFNDDLKKLELSLFPIVETLEKFKTKITSINENEGSLHSNELKSFFQKIGIDFETIENNDYFNELATEINIFFKKYFIDKFGMISLLEGYCIFNKFRGQGKLISPEDFKSAINCINTKDFDIKFETFRSDISVIKSNNFSFKSIYNNCEKLLFGNLCFDSNDFANHFGIQNNLAKWVLEEMLKLGYFVLDETEFQIKYYSNNFLIENK